jgi:hypothetical protein
VLCLGGKYLSNVLLSTGDCYVIYRAVEGDTDVKEKAFEQELTRCMFFKKALPERVRVKSASSTKTLWVIRPDRFNDIFKNQTPDAEAVRGLYDSEYSDIREFIAASVQEERKAQ